MKDMGMQDTVLVPATPEMLPAETVAEKATVVEMAQGETPCRGRRKLPPTSFAEAAKQGPAFNPETVLGRMQSVGRMVEIIMWKQ